MAVYSDKQIKQAIDGGHIICHPFDSQRLSKVSLDLTLGYYYYRINTKDEKAVYNPFDKDEVDRFFIGPYKALPLKKWSKMHGLSAQNNIPPDHPVISLKPGERILAHTHEFLGTFSPICEIRGKSSWVRSGLAVCLDSTLCNPGSVSRLTLEIINFNQTKSILLAVGEPIAQAIFQDAVGQDSSSTDSYRQADDLETAIKTWSPDKMLPQTYNSARVLPPKIEGMIYD